MIVAGPLAGFTVAVAALRPPLELGAALEHHGARVVHARLAAPPGDEGGYRPPADRGPGQAVLGGVLDGTLDGLVVLDGPSARGLLRLAGRRRTRVVAALTGAGPDPVVLLALDEGGAEPLRDAGLPVLLPARTRPGPLVRAVLRELPARRGRQVVLAGHRLEVRGHLALVDGVVVPLDGPSAAALRRLAARPGRPVRLPAAVVDRLQAQLGDSRLLVRAGRATARLAVDEAHGPG